MRARDDASKLPVKRPAERHACIVMACADMSEADQVAQQLLKLNMGCLVTYRRAEDLMYNAPSGKVALVILATQDKPPMLRRALLWLKRRWPRCSIMVIGNSGCDVYEMTARLGGASYLARPVTPQQWHALLCHALSDHRQVEIEGAAH